MKLNFQIDFVERTIAGQSLHFFPIRMRMIERLREAGGPLVDSVMRLTAPQLDPGGSRTEDTVDTKDGIRRVVSESTPIPLPVLEAQARERAASARTLLETLTSPKTRDLIYALLADSLREDEKAIAEGLAEAPVTVVGEMLVAWAEAQAGVPFAQQARDLFQSLRARVQADMTGLVKSSETDMPGSESLTPSMFSPELDTDLKKSEA